MDPHWMTTLTGAVALSLTHTLIPSHWLIFVLAARTQKWTLGKTMLVTAVCGSGHVLSTVLLGVAGAMVGEKIIGDPYLDWIVSGILVAIGGAYLITYWVRKEHHHHHHPVPLVSDRATVLTLMTMLILSPCEAVMSAFLAGAGILDIMFATVLGITLLITTVGIMLLLVSVTFLGMGRFQFHFLEHHEKAIVGTILILLGAVTAVVK